MRPIPVANTTAVSLGELNRIGTIGNLGTIALSSTSRVGINDLDATGSIKVVNLTDLSVRGGAVVHAGDDQLATFHPGGTPIETAEIDIAPNAAAVGGTLAVNGTVQAGIDGLLTGNVVLQAGGGATSGSVNVAGGVFASNGGTVGIFAGVDPVTSSLNLACGPLACNITIGGTVWGDHGAPFNLAGTVSLDAGSFIFEPGAIGAFRLFGLAGSFVDLSGAGAPTANKIVQLGPFDSNRVWNNTAGFLLRDNWPSLTVVGAVTDHAVTVAAPVSRQRLAPGFRRLQHRPWVDLIAAPDRNPSSTVKLQATGNVRRRRAVVTPERW
jgi:hypothetical protein